MTEYMPVLINQIIIFAIILLVGFIAAKTKVVTREGLNTLSVLIVKVILPALIFSIIAASGVTIEDFMISGRFAAGVVLSFTLLIAAGVFMSRFCKLQDKTANIFIALTVFGNMGFMGIPLIEAVFKEPAAQVSISVYTIIDMALLWTLGVYLCSRHQNGTNPLSAVKNMINPTTVALFTAFIVMAFEIPVPKLLMNTIYEIGGITKYLALIYLGASLAFVSVNNIFKKPSIFMLVAVKMLIMPMIVYFLLDPLLPEVPLAILTLIVGLPAMTTIVMIAKTYGSDDEFATEIIFATGNFILPLRICCNLLCCPITTFYEHI